MQAHDKIPVLLVDDRPKNLAALVAILEDTGLDLVTASSGNDALRLTLKERFALVIMDVQMPEMDGFETAELMRSNPRTSHVPIIFVTAGMNDRHFVFRGYESGAVDYLMKPIEPLFLRSKVRVFCDLYRQRLEIESYGNDLQRLVEDRTAVLQWTADQLTVEKQFSDTIINSLPGLFYVFDEQQHLIRWNHHLTEIFGVVYEEMPYKPFNEYIAPEYRRQVSAKFLEVIETGNPVDMELEFIDMDGRKIPYHCTGSLMLLNDKRFLVGVATNIAERKQLEEQLRQSQKMEALGTLAGGVAHDFNNILTIIMGYASLLTMKMRSDSACAAMADEIVSSVDRASELTRSLLAFSRKQDVILQPVDLNTILSGLKKSLSRLIREDIEFTLQLAGTPLYAMADKSQIEQAIINLTVNARDAMKSGGRLILRTEEIPEMDADGGESPIKRRYGLIVVEDSGEGMDQQTRERIFEPFFTTKEVGRGTGLGLSMVYGVVKKHNGIIKAESEPGQGSTFRIYLPLLDGLPAEVGDDRRESLPRGSETILLVEDDATIRQMTKLLLEMYGYTVLVAENGDEAVSLFRDHRDTIRLLITDIIMPKKNGCELSEEIGRLGGSIPTIFMSGYSAEIMAEKGLTVQDVNYISKPLKPARLLTMIRNVLAGRLGAVP